MFGDETCLQISTLDHPCRTTSWIIFPMTSLHGLPHLDEERDFIDTMPFLAQAHSCFQDANHRSGFCQSQHQKLLIGNTQREKARRVPPGMRTERVAACNQNMQNQWWHRLISWHFICNHVKQNTLILRLESTYKTKQYRAFQRSTQKYCNMTAWSKTCASVAVGGVDLSSLWKPPFLSMLAAKTEKIHDLYGTHTMY